MQRPMSWLKIEKAHLRVKAGFSKRIFHYANLLLASALLVGMQ